MSQLTQTTARDLIRRSMMLVGVLGQGENPSASEAADALRTLNEMIEKWSLESLMLYTTKTVKFNLVPGKQNYTIGPAGEVVALRPIQKLNAAWLNIISTGPVTTIPMAILSNIEWGDITTKGTTSTYPLWVYYNPNYPLGNLSFWPVPQGSDEVDLLVQDQFVGFASLNDVIDMPPGYAKALRYCLAAELAVEYGRPIPDAVQAGGVSAKASIKATNSPIEYVQLDPAVTWSGSRTWNWRTGDYS